MKCTKSGMTFNFVQYDGTVQSVIEMRRAFGKDKVLGHHLRGVLIATQEGEEHVKTGDYVVQGLMGNLKNVKKAVFEADYQIEESN